MEPNKKEMTIEGKYHDTIILYEDAAEKKTMTGWVVGDRFFGDNEELARYAGCTHRKCECGKLMEKQYTKCEDCCIKAGREKYNAMPFEEWDRKKPVSFPDGEPYFFSAEDIEEYLTNNNLQPSDLRLVICEPNHFDEITSEYWHDVLPEDGEIPDELQAKLDELNKLIKTLPPASYLPSDVRTEYKRL